MAVALIIFQNLTLQYDNYIEAIKFLEKKRKGVKGDVSHALRLINFEKMTTYQSLQNFLSQQQKTFKTGELLIEDEVNSKEHAWNEEQEKAYKQVQKSMSETFFYEKRDANYQKIGTQVKQRR